MATEGMAVTETWVTPNSASAAICLGWSFVPLRSRGSPGIPSEPVVMTLAPGRQAARGSMTVSGWSPENLASSWGTTQSQSLGRRAPVIIRTVSD